MEASKGEKALGPHSLKKTLSERLPKMETSKTDGSYFLKTISGTCPDYTDCENGH